MGVRTKSRSKQLPDPYGVPLDEPAVVYPSATPRVSPQTPLISYPELAVKRSLIRPRPTESPIDRVSLSSVHRRAVSAEEIDAKRRRQLQLLAQRRETPDGRPLPQRVVEARRERERLVGQTIALSPEWKDPDNQDSPFALDATFGLGRIPLKLHAEQLEWTHAQFHPSGTMLKARSAHAIERMARVLDRITPLLQEFELELGCIYDRGGQRFFNLISEELISPRGRSSRVLDVAVLDSTRADGDEQLISLLRQLTKLQERRTRENHRDGGATSDTSQHFETLLNHYIESYATDDESRNLRAHWRGSHWNPHRVVAPRESPREFPLPDATLNEALDAMIAELDLDGGLR